MGHTEEVIGPVSVTEIYWSEIVQSVHHQTAR
jgi:hypothetical protein